MDADIFRLNFYSFMLGTQVSSLSNVVCQSSSKCAATPERVPSMRRIRFPKTYKQRSILGNTIIYLKTNDRGNVVKYGSKLLITGLEKNVLGGFLYCFAENDLLGGKHSVASAFISGTIIGACSNWRQQFRNGIFDRIVCGIPSGLLAIFGEKIRETVISADVIPRGNFNINLSEYEPTSFITGAMTALFVVSFHFPKLEDYADVFNYYDELTLGINNDDSTLEKIQKFIRFSYQGLGCLLSYELFSLERILMGGVVYCTIEEILKQMAGLTNPLITVPVCGSAVGIYQGIHTHLMSIYQQTPWECEVKNGLKLSVVFSSCFRIYQVAKREALIAYGYKLNA